MFPKASPVPNRRGVPWWHSGGSIPPGTRWLPKRVSYYTTKRKGCNMATANTVIAEAIELVKGSGFDSDTVDDAVRIIEGFDPESFDPDVESLTAWAYVLLVDAADALRETGEDASHERAEWRSEVVYTAEALDYYRDNYNEVEEIIDELDLMSGANSPMDAITAGVAGAIAREIREEFDGLADFIEAITSDELGIKA